MSVIESLRRFSDDQRAVSAVIGFILIFGILTLTLTVYQAQIVPQQNAQTEFTHFEETRDELIEVRNAISRTGQAGDPQFPSVTLGTTYQSRTLTINPAPAFGTLQTSEDDISILIRNESGDEIDTITTHFIEYQPGYNELDVASTWYENSVLYTDVSGENNTIIEEQNLVTDGTTLKITAIENGFEETGTSRTTLEMNRNRTDIEFNESENLTVEIPTRQGPEYWDDALEEYENGDNLTYNKTESQGDIYTVRFDNVNSTNISTIEVDT